MARWRVTLIAYFDKVVEVEASNRKEARKQAEYDEIIDVVQDWDYRGGTEAIDEEELEGGE